MTNYQKRKLLYVDHMDPMMEVVEIEAKDKLTSTSKLLSRSLLETKVSLVETHGTDEGAREGWNLVSTFAPQEKSDGRGKRPSNKNMKRKKKKIDDEKEEIEKVHQLITKFLENESDNNDPAEKAGKKLESPSNAIDDVTQLAGSEHVNSAVSVGETDRDTATGDGWGAVSKLAPKTVHKNRNNNTDVALTAHGITDGSFFPTESTNISTIIGIAVLSCVVIASVLLVRVAVVKKQKRKSQASKEATIARSISTQEEIADSGSIAISVDSSVTSRSTIVYADDSFPHWYYFDGSASVSSGSYEDEDTDVATLKEYIRKIMKG